MRMLNYRTATQAELCIAEFEVCVCNQGGAEYFRRPKLQFEVRLEHCYSKRLMCVRICTNTHVGSMNLNTIEACIHSIASSLSELINNLQHEGG